MVRTFIKESSDSINWGTMMEFASPCKDVRISCTARLAAPKEGATGAPPAEPPSLSGSLLPSSACISSR
eukprot:3526644-Alexandrium_andersonii.AAC.1